MRKKFEMTQEELTELIAACRPVPMIMLQCGEPPSQQRNANSAWQNLAKKYGFKWDTVAAYPGEGQRFFSAEDASDLL